jgi:hypothetical protein
MVLDPMDKKALAKAFENKIDYTLFKYETCPLFCAEAYSLKMV